MVVLKTRAELACMRQAGRVVAHTLKAVARAAHPGARLLDLDSLAAELIARMGAQPSFLGYQPTWAPRPYPGVVCLSVNDAIVHGIPDRRVLRAGDLLSIDCGASIDGYHADAAISIGIGALDPDSRRLIDTTEAALAAGIAAVTVGAHLGAISHAIEAVARGAGYGLPTGLGGHGIGRAMHEEPHIPNFGDPRRGLRLVEGLAIAIEPMLVIGGSNQHRTCPDGWTVVTLDGSRAAHAEHTIALTRDGPEILTIP
jgi:methionyl aminopeptidase